MPPERDRVSGLEPDDLAAARSLFFDHDGSGFYMDRDGVLARFQSLAVPAAVQVAWEHELLARHLDALDAPGNWRTVHSLLHHGHLQHLPRLLATTPAGRLWECCAYLEELLKYLDQCAEANTVQPAGDRPAAHAADDLQDALRTVISRAEALRGRARSATSRARIDAIITHTGARLTVLNSPGAPAAWHWNPLTCTASPPHG
jgi:hypothetical protein